MTVGFPSSELVRLKSLLHFMITPMEKHISLSSTATFRLGTEALLASRFRLTPATSSILES